MTTLFSHATVLCMDEAGTVLQDGYVLVRGREIAYVGPIRPQERADREVNATGKVLMPGFVDAHTHLTMSLMRGYGGGHDLQTWLNDYIFPVEAKLDSRAVRAGTALSLAEAIADGVTSVSDMYYFCDDIIAEVVKAASAPTSPGAPRCSPKISFPKPTRLCRNPPAHGKVAQLQRRADQNRRLHPRRIHLNPKLWTWMADFARSHGLQMHVHLSETKAEQEGLPAAPRHDPPPPYLSATVCGTPQPSPPTACGPLRKTGKSSAAMVSPPCITRRPT